MKVSASAVSLTDEDGTFLLAFADCPDEPSWWLFLMMANNPDGQDLTLGQGGVYFEFEPRGLVDYDLVEDVRETEAGVLVELRSDVAKVEQIDPQIEIEVEGKERCEADIREGVRRIKERLVSWERTRSAVGRSKLEDR